MLHLKFLRCCDSEIKCARFVWSGQFLALQYLRDNSKQWIFDGSVYAHIPYQVGQPSSTAPAKELHMQTSGIAWHTI